MLRTGQEHLESLRDGRVVYIGSERVDDVTIHPAFRNRPERACSCLPERARRRDPGGNETQARSLGDQLTLENRGIHERRMAWPRAVRSTV